MIKEVAPEKSVMISKHARTCSQTAAEIVKKIQVPSLIPLGEIVPGSASLVTSDPLSIFPDMENILDISLIKVETDCEDEIEPEKVQISFPVKLEKSPVASGSRLQRRPTAPGLSKRRWKRKFRLRSQDMIEEGIYYPGSEPESEEDNCLQLFAKDFMDLED